MPTVRQALEHLDRQAAGDREALEVIVDRLNAIADLIDRVAAADLEPEAPLVWSDLLASGTEVDRAHLRNLIGRAVRPDPNQPEEDEGDIQ